MRILIIRLSALGDVIHTLPVAAAIKRHIPGVHITWVVQPLAAPLLYDNPAVDRVIVFPGKSVLPNLMATPHMVTSLRRLGDFWRELRSNEYDIAIDAQGLLKSALLSWLSGAKMRLGFAQTREWADKFLTHKVDVGDYFGPNIHIVDLNLKLVLRLFELLGLQIMDINAEFSLPKPSENVRKKIRTYLPPLKLSGISQAISLVVLIPGTTWESKIWTVDKWQALGRILVERLRCDLVICGGQSESITNQQIEEYIVNKTGQKVINLTGKTDLLDLIALYNDAQIVFGSDSGPLHLAAATGLPKIIAIHGSTPWKRNGPYGANGLAVALNLECQPCFQKKCPLKTLACLNDLTAEEVYRQAMEFFDKG